MDNLINDIVIVHFCRYIYRENIIKNTSWYETTLANLNDQRFEMIVRVPRIVFDLILDLIKENPVFHGQNSNLQFSPFFQLALVLYRLGSSGENASRGKTASLFGVGDGGTINKITQRIFECILPLQNNFISWPSNEERNQIVLNTIEELPHCIGYLDGSEIPLNEKPLLDSTSYYSRSKIYSLKLQAICDHNLRIRHILVGYPGSVHDARIFNNCSIGRNINRFLSEGQWIAADSAYRLTEHVITPYRKTSRMLREDQRKMFNRYFSKYRVRIEHFFGKLKEKFGSLKNLKLKIFNDISHKYACDWVRVCCILYNIALPYNTIDDFEYDDFEMELNQEIDENIDNVNIDSVGEDKREALFNVLFT